LGPFSFFGDRARIGRLLFDSLLLLSVGAFRVNRLIGRGRIVCQRHLVVIGGAFVAILRTELFLKVAHVIGNSIAGFAVGRRFTVGRLGHLPLLGARLTRFSQAGFQLRQRLLGYRQAGHVTLV